MRVMQLIELFNIHFGDSSGTGILNIPLEDGLDPDAIPPFSSSHTSSPSSSASFSSTLYEYIERFSNRPDNLKSAVRSEVKGKLQSILPGKTRKREGLPCVLCAKSKIISPFDFLSSNFPTTIY